MPDDTQVTTGEVVIVGAGLSGLATAIGLAERGRKVTVLEAADKVGGAAAYSGGQVWVGANHVALREGITGDSKEMAERYIRAISYRNPELRDDVAMRRWIDMAPEAMRYWEDIGAIRWAVIPGFADYYNDADGAMPAGRYLTNAVFDASNLGDWRERMLVSPYFPVGTSYADLFERGRRNTIVEEDEGTSKIGGQVQGMGQSELREAASSMPDKLTFGTGVVGSFLAKAIRDPRITILTGHRVSALKTAPDGTVIGAIATTDTGTVEFDGPVVLATSGFDNDPDLVREFIGLEPEQWGSVGPKTIRGDGIKLARSVGGATVKLPAGAHTMQPGWKSNYNEGFSYGPDTAMPHTMIVNRKGQRYTDDSYWPDIARATMADTAENLPFFLIFDEQSHNKYGLGMTPPGEPYPEGIVTSADTLAELAEKLGIDPAGLEAQVARFNVFAETGDDEDFGRGRRDYVKRFYGDPNNKPNPVLGTIAQAPFHGMKLRFIGPAMGNSGVHIDSDGHVLNGAGQVIPGLHAVGTCTAQTVTGTGYNSGIALGRGLSMAYLVARAITGAN